MHVLHKALRKYCKFCVPLYKLFNAYFYPSHGNNIFKREKEQDFSSHYFRVLQVHFRTSLSLKFGE